MLRNRIPKPRWAFWWIRISLVLCLSSLSTFAAVQSEPSILRIVLQPGESLTKTIRFTNQCAKTHQFQLVHSALDFLSLPGSGDPFLVAAGASSDVEFEVKAGGLEETRRKGGIRVHCLTCASEPGCEQGDLELDIEVLVRELPWTFRALEDPDPLCPVTGLHGAQIVDLFVSRLDATTCVPDTKSSSRNIKTGEAGFSRLQKLDRQWRLEFGGQKKRVGQLDNQTSYSPIERFFLSYLGPHNPSPAMGGTLERALVATALLDLIVWKRSREKSESWLPEAKWLSAALSVLSQISRNQSRVLTEELTGEEIQYLGDAVSELAERAGIDLPGSGWSPYLPDVERLNLDAVFEPEGFQWGEAQPGSHPLMSFSAFQRDALYGEFGYYTTDHASIGRTGHFETVPQKAFPVFGGLIGELAHQIYRQLEQQGQGSSFVIREDGGGRGELARSLMLYLQTQALLQPESSYRRLWDRLSYLAVEISPERVKEQTAEVMQLERQGVLRTGRFGTVLSDATRFVSRPALNGFIFSNELLDVLPVEKFYVEDSGRVRLICPIPYLPARLDRIYFFHSEPGKEAIAESRAFASSYELPHREDRIYLPASRFREYQTWLRGQEAVLPMEELRGLLPDFLEGLVSVEHVPGLGQLVQSRYSDLLGGLVYRGESESEAYLEIAKSAYLATVDRSLASGGVLLIDYMSVSNIPNNAALLTYGETRSEGRWANPYVHFGLQDITLPPDSQLLTQEVRRLNWDFGKFDRQESLLELSRVLTDPAVGLGLLAGHTRLLAMTRLQTPDSRRAFDAWLIEEAKGLVNGEALLESLETRLPAEFGRVLDRDAIARLRRTQSLYQPDVLWEPENPNFYLLLATKNLERRP